MRPGSTVRRYFPLALPVDFQPSLPVARQVQVEVPPINKEFQTLE